MREKEANKVAKKVLQKYDKLSEAGFTATQIWVTITKKGVEISLSAGGLGGDKAAQDKLNSGNKNEKGEPKK